MVNSQRELGQDDHIAADDTGVASGQLANLNSCRLGVSFDHLGSVGSGLHIGAVGQDLNGHGVLASLVGSNLDFASGGVIVQLSNSTGSDVAAAGLSPVSYTHLTLPTKLEV